MNTGKDGNQNTLAVSPWPSKRDRLVVEPARPLPCVGVGTICSWESKRVTLPRGRGREDGHLSKKNLSKGHHSWWLLICLALG